MNIPQYQIIFCEAETGILLSENGERSLDDQAIYSPKFYKLDDAILKCNELLERFIYGEVEITDLKTEKTISRARSSNFDLYLDDKLKFYKWNSLPFFIKWFNKKPKLKYF